MAPKIIRNGTLELNVLKRGTLTDTVCNSVANVITNLPKLTNKELSYTGIGWENPVSKSFLPKTKFRLGFTR